MSIRSGPAWLAISVASRMVSISLPKIWMPMGRSYSKISSFWRLFAASRISPSEEMNSVYIISTPFCLHTKRNGGSLTSSMGARRRGKSPRSIFPILTDIRITGTKVRKIFTPRGVKTGKGLQLLYKLLDCLRRIRRSHEVLADEKTLKAGLPQLADRCRVTDSAFRNPDKGFGDQFHELQRVIQRDRKVLQVTVIHPDGVHVVRQAALQLFPVMYFQ